VYCPECRVEYREGSTECADCQVPLLAGTPPPEAESAFDPNLELVVVLETCDAFALALAKGLLAEAGIPFFVLNEVSMLVTDVDPMLRKWVRIQVASDREAEARDLLARISQPEPGGVDTDES
jgi:hypothetical protein